MSGKGVIEHNRRTYIAENVDPERTHLNIEYCYTPIEQAYHELFDEALAAYNAKQKRKDRCIENYYKKICDGDQEKPFYEVIFQIGNKDDMSAASENGNLARAILDKFMRSFQERNPHLHVFSAHLHMDEATPHLHIDYIPVGHYKRGQDTQNGIAQALKEMGYGEGKMAIAKWRAAEVEVLNKICLEHGIQPLAPEKARGTLEVEEYKEQRRQADELAEQNAQVKAELGEKREMLKAVKEKTAKLAEIDSIETGKTVFGGKVTVSQEDWQNITDLARKEVASQKQTKKLRKERDDAVRERDALKTKLSAVSSELATYKKAEEQKGLFTREKLKKEAKRISREDELSRELRKAKAFISACGLSADFQQYKYNSNIRKNVLE